MPSNSSSPLETLAAFFIVFATGVLSVYGMTRYVEKIRKDTRNTIGRSS